MLPKACLSLALDLSVDKKDDGLELDDGSRDASEVFRGLVGVSGVVSVDFALL